MFQQLYDHISSNSLITQNWIEITDKDIDEAVELLSSTIITAANQHIPTKLVRVRNDKPFFSVELRREMRKTRPTFQTSTAEKYCILTEME